MCGLVCSGKVFGCGREIHIIVSPRFESYRRGQGTLHKRGNVVVGYLSVCGPFDSRFLPEIV